MTFTEPSLSGSLCPPRSIGQAWIGLVEQTQSRTRKTRPWWPPDCVYFCTCGCPQADSARRQGHSHQASHPTRVEGAQPNHRTNKTTATQPKEPSHGWGRNPITQPRLIHALQTGKKLRQEKHQYATDHEEVLPWTVVQMVFWTNVNQACRLWTSTMLWPWRTQPKREDNISPGLGGISWSGGRLGHSHTIWSQVPRHEQPSQTQSVVG